MRLLVVGLLLTASVAAAAVGLLNTDPPSRLGLTGGALVAALIAFYFASHDGKDRGRRDARRRGRGRGQLVEVERTLSRLLDRVEAQARTLAEVSDASVAAEAESRRQILELERRLRELESAWEADRAERRRLRDVRSTRLRKVRATLDNHASELEKALLRSDS